MAVEPLDLKVAVPGTKNKASDYNANFTEFARFLNDTLSETLSIYQDVKTLSTTGTIALEDNTINTITPTGKVTFTLPATVDVTA